MLVDVLGLEKGRDQILDVIASVNGGNPVPMTAMTGIYLMAHWSLDRMLQNIGIRTESYPGIALRNPRTGEYVKGESVPAYGVCDSPEQIFEKFEKSLDAADRKFVIGMVRLDKKDQSKEGGWRWHKWGEYIGDQNPTMEYLADEPVIETVYTFHIYELLNS